MSILFQVLGQPGRDNALLVRIDSGQAVENLLFDCGEGCLSGLSYGEILSVDHLFFSHLHMDHVGGFDTFFRATNDRSAKHNHVWGPARTSEIIQHRFRGYLWNLHETMFASWRVHDVDQSEVRTTRFELQEAFAVPHLEGTSARRGIICEGAGYTVDAIIMEHRGPCLAYVVREKPRRNVDKDRMVALGLRAGPWIREMLDSEADRSILVLGEERSLTDLRQDLIIETPGESIAYLTDFLMDDAAVERLLPVVHGVDTIVCESQYRGADKELAARNYHMTAGQAAGLAARAGAGKLILFHLSERYRPPEWREMLEEARQVFPNTSFPAEWTVVE